MNNVRLAVFAITLPFALRASAEDGADRKVRRVDLYGDVLPDGAIARLGTVRFRQPGNVHGIAFSEDGNLIAAASDGPNTVVLWDRATGRKVHEIVVADKGSPPRQLRFSVDSKRLYCSYWHGDHMQLYAWDVLSGKDAQGLPRLPRASRTLGYSSDARELIVLRRDEEILRWDIAKGIELGRYSKPLGFISIAALRGECLLVPRFDRQAVRMCDVVQNKELWSVETKRDKNSPALPMAFSRDGRLFVFEGPPNAISVYDSLTGALVRRLECDVGSVYQSISISDDGQLVAGSNRDGWVRLWDLTQKAEPVRAPTSSPVSFSPDGKVFATPAHGVLLWETATGKRIEPFTGHTAPVSSISFSPDGRTAATCAWLGDAVVRLWDPDTGALRRSLAVPDAALVYAIDFSPDGQSLAGCCWEGDKKVRIWDAVTGRERHALRGHEALCSTLAFAPDGRRMASADSYSDRTGKYSGCLCIWDVDNGNLIREIRGTDGAIQQVLFTRDGRQIIAGANGVHVYDAGTGQLVGEPFQTKGRIWGLALSPDGRLLATADGPGPIRLWELATRRELPIKVHNAYSVDVQISPDGRIVAAQGNNNTVVLFHWPTGETVGTLAGSPLGPRYRFSPDGRRLATASKTDSTALIWDIAALVNRPLPALPKPTEADLTRWWDELGDKNPGTAYSAVWRFVAAPQQSLSFFASRLRPATAAEATASTRLIKALGSPEFKERDAAFRELEALGEAAVEPLRKAKKDEASVEQLRRIDQLLTTLAGPALGPGQLRQHRALAVLEQIGDAGAKELVARLAAGAAGASFTREASESLQRFNKRANDESR